MSTAVEHVNAMIATKFEQLRELACACVMDLKTLDTKERDSARNRIMNFENLVLTEEDVLKRKRTKTFVPQYERCLGKKANGDRCTRRKKTSEDLCGTHMKGVPHGMISDIKDCNVEKVTVYAKEIQGIVYYVDDASNVYDTEDVYQNHHNPRVVAKYTVDLDNNYEIVS